MLPKQTIRKIHDLSYIQCPKPEHQYQQLSFLCLNSQCEDNRLSCCHCEFSQHPNHVLVPLKSFLTHIHQQKHLVNPLTSINTSNNLGIQQTQKTPNPTFNYLSCIQSIENTKNSSIKNLNQLKQTLIQQITKLQTQIEINANRYIQKIQLISQVYFSNQDIVSKINHFKQNIPKVQKIIQEFIENMRPPQKINQNQTNSQMNSSYMLDKKNQAQNCQKQFIQVSEAFSKKIANFQKSLTKFDLSLFPKLSKTLEYENIKFSNISNYQWDPLYKAQGFQIVSPQNKIIRVQFQSNDSQRVGLMKTSILKESKNKLTWAIKINKLTGWIGVGLGLRKVIVNAKYKFNYNAPGHGMYIISGNGYTWSHSMAESNSKYQGFSFLTGDTIVMQYDPIVREIVFRKNDGKENPKVLKVAEYENEDFLCPCVNMLSKNDEVEIIPVPSGY